MSHKDNGAPFRASMSDRVRVRAWFGAVLLNGGGMGCFVPVMGSAPGAPLWSPRGPNVWFVLGGVLLSRTLAGAVPSALSGLASGFGMGAGRFPVAVTTETTIWAVRYRRLVCCYSIVWPPLQPTLTLAWWCVVGGWVGCGPYSGRSRLLLVLTPPFCPACRLAAGAWARCVFGGVVVCVGLLVPVSSVNRCRSSTSGLSTQ